MGAVGRQGAGGGGGEGLGLCGWWGEAHRLIRLPKIYWSSLGSFEFEF